MENKEKAQRGYEMLYKSFSQVLQNVERLDDASDGNPDLQRMLREVTAVAVDGRKYSVVYNRADSGITFICV